MNAAENDKLGLVLRTADLRKLEAVAGEIGETNDVVLLVMMTENDEARAEGFLTLHNGIGQFVVR